MTWHAEVILDAEISTAAQEDLTAALPGFATISAEEQAGRATVALVVDATTLRQATEAALRTVNDAARVVLGTVKLAGVRVLPEADYRAEIERPSSVDLVSATEGGEVLGVSRQRFEELARTHPDFPPHVAELRRGKIYTRASIEAFNNRWERKRTGRPPKHKPAN